MTFVWEREGGRNGFQMWRVDSIKIRTIRGCMYTKNKHPFVVCTLPRTSGSSMEVWRSTPLNSDAEEGALDETPPHMMDDDDDDEPPADLAADPSLPVDFAAWREAARAAVVGMDTLSQQLDEVRRQLCSLASARLRGFRSDWLVFREDM